MGKRRGNQTTMRFEPRRIIDPTKTWFVVLAATSLEHKAEASLVGSGVDVWLPQFQTVTVRRGRKVEIVRRFFPGYLFAGLGKNENGELPISRDLYGNDDVLDVLGRDKPLAVPAGVIQAIADKLTGNVKSERVQAAALFRIGEMRAVAQGPFATFMATVTELLASGRVRAEVNIFGHMTPVEFDPEQLGAA